MLQTQPVGNRIILLTAGIGLALCAVWGGSEWMASPKGQWETAGLWSVVIVSIFVALCAYLEVLATLEMHGHLDGITGVVFAIVAAIALGFVLGVAIAGEGRRYSPWLFLLILGLTPMAIAIKDVIADAIDVLNAGAVSTGHVREVRR